MLPFDFQILEDEGKEPKNSTDNNMKGNFLFNPILDTQFPDMDTQLFDMSTPLLPLLDGFIPNDETIYTPLQNSPAVSQPFLPSQSFQPAQSLKEEIIKNLASLEARATSISIFLKMMEGPLKAQSVELERVNNQIDQERCSTTFKINRWASLTRYHKWKLEQKFKAKDSQSDPLHAVQNKVISKAKSKKNK